MMYYFIKAGLIALTVLLLQSTIQAPTISYYCIRVRLTAYSPKQKYENCRTATGRCAKNEVGIAVPKGFLSFGTKVILPDGDVRVVDDRIPNKSARRFNHKVVDIRYYQSINSRPKTKAVNKELRREFDMGYGLIKVLQ